MAVCLDTPAMPAMVVRAQVVIDRTTQAGGTMKALLTALNNFKHNS